MTKRIPKRDPDAEHRAAAHELVERLVAHVRATRASVEGNVLRVCAVRTSRTAHRVVWYYRGLVTCRIKAAMILTTHVHERQILARKISVD